MQPAAATSDRLPKAAWNNLRVLVPLLLVSMLAADLAVYWTLDPRPSARLSYRTILAGALAHSQVGLASIWIGISWQGSNALKLGCFVSTLIGWTSVIVEYHVFGRSVALSLILMSIMAITWLCILRWLSFRLVAPGDSSPNSRLQYPLSRIFLWMAMAAAMAFILRPFVNELSHWKGIMLFHVLPFSITALLAVWAALTAGPMWRRTITLVLVSPLLAATPFYLYLELNEAFHATAMCEIHGLLLLGYLLPFRLGGYRLMRLHTSSAERSSCVA